MRIIAGVRKGAKLFEVSSKQTRSTTDRVKEAMFNIIGPYFSGGVCLDFFAGSGSLCLEALSRGMDYAYLFDLNDEPVKVIKQNIAKLRFEEQTFVKKCNFKQAISYVNKQLDLVFLDPPYGYGYVDLALKLLKTSNLLHKGCIIVCEIEQCEIVNYEGYNLINEYSYGRIKLVVLEW